MNCYCCNKELKFTVQLDFTTPLMNGKATNYYKFQEVKNSICNCCATKYIIGEQDSVCAERFVKTLTKTLMLSYWSDDNTTYIYCNKACVYEFSGNELFKISISDIQNKIDNIMVLV